MTDLLFVLKAHATLAVGYFLYVLFFRKGASLQARRIYLMVLPVIAVIIPLLAAQPAIVRVELPVISVQEIVGAEHGISAGEVNRPLWLYVYLTIAALMEAALLIQLIGMVLQIRNAKTVRFHDHILVEDTAVAAPHSFFHYIFLPQMSHGSARAMILKHELVHAQQRHSADVLCMMTARALFWINPISWIMLKELRLTHECIADAAAGREQPDEYAALLVTQQFDVPVQFVSNTFYQPSQIKQRLMMLNSHARSGTMKRLFLLIPFIALLGIMNLTAQESQKPADAAAGLESMPEFPGGNDALVNFLVANIHYPETASKAGIQGTVYIEFVVKKNGKVDDIKVVKSADPALDAEALRVVQLMPKWTPAVKGGKNVDASTMLPVKFALN